MSTQEITTKGPSKIYRREVMASLKPTQDRSLIYWRSQARSVFANYPNVQMVECVTNGRKTDSQVITKGDELAPEGVYVIIASTGGKWSKSRRDFRPTA
jgi:hypothetical protein